MNPWDILLMLAGWVLLALACIVVAVLLAVIVIVVFRLLGQALRGKR